MSRKDSCRRLDVGNHRESHGLRLKTIRIQLHLAIVKVF